MSTLIKRVDIERGLPDIRVPDGAGELLVLAMYHGTPLGDLRFRSEGGIVTSEELARLVAERFCAQITRIWYMEQTKRSVHARYTGGAPSISVIIPTCDRPDDLRRCLRALSQAEYQRKTVIVVDNGSDSAVTCAVAAQYGAKYVREPRRGLDFARNAGILASDSEIVAFADDDVVVDKMWLSSIAEAFLEDFGIACVTGLTMPMEMETEAQELFERYCDGGLRRGYGRRILHRLDLSPAAAGKAGAGANMAIRRSVLDKIGLFDNALDCGTPAKAGGDTDMFYRLLRHGFKICYEPRALSWHRHRRSMEELGRQLTGYSIAVYAYLTKCLFEYRDAQALVTGLSWFANHHLKNLILCAVGRHHMPGGIVLSEFLGVFRGPGAYFKSKAYARRESARFGQSADGVPVREEARRYMLAKSVAARFAENIRR